VVGTERVLVMHPRAKAAYLAEIVEGGQRSAKPITCKRCGAACLQGDDHDNTARVITVAAQPVTPVEEMIAILDGRTTCDLIKARGKTARPGSHDLHIREPWHVHAARHPHPIHVEHRCERPA